MLMDNTIDIKQYGSQKFGSEGGSQGVGSDGDPAGVLHTESNHIKFHKLNMYHILSFFPFCWTNIGISLFPAALRYANNFLNRF